MAFLLMRGADQARYRSLMKNLCEQFSLGNDQYTKTLVMATDVLSNHKLDQKYYDNKKKIVEKKKMRVKRMINWKQASSRNQFNATVVAKMDMQYQNVQLRTKYLRMNGSSEEQC